jgi:hypothetical protein
MEMQKTMQVLLFVNKKKLSAGSGKKNFVLGDFAAF